MWADLADALSQLEQSRDIDGLVLQSAKSNVFIAGADLKELANVPTSDDRPTRQFIEEGLRVLAALENLPFPTVACIDGAALGGGLEVALACDFRIAGTNPKTKFGLPEVALGLIPGWGGTQRLPRIIGRIAAIYMLIQSATIDAETAQIQGLVDHVHPSESLRQSGKELLTKSLQDGSWHDRRERKKRAGEVNSVELDVLHRFISNLTPRTQRAALAAFDVVVQGFPLPLEEGLKFETQAFLNLAASPEAHKLIAEFFAARGK